MILLGGDAGAASSVPKRGQWGSCLCKDCPHPRGRPRHRAAVCLSGRGTSLSSSVKTSCGKCSPASQRLCPSGLGGEAGRAAVACVGGGALIPPPGEDAALRVLWQTQPWAGGISNISRKGWLSRKGTLDPARPCARVERRGPRSSPPVTSSKRDAERKPVSCQTGWQGIHGGGRVPSQPGKEQWGHSASRPPRRGNACAEAQG